MVWLERAWLAISCGVLGLAGACGSGGSHGGEAATGGMGAAAGGGARGGATAAGTSPGGASNAGRGGSAGTGAQGGTSHGGSTSEGGAAGDDGPGQGGTTSSAGGHGATGGIGGSSAADGGQSGSAGEAGVAGLAGDAGAGGAPELASCTDTEKNGSESDSDCGGSCPLCDDGKSCRQGGDCVSGHCVGKVCVQPPTFGSPVDLASGGLSQFNLAMGDFGNAAIFWEDATNDRVWSRVSSSKTFGTAFRMDGNNGRPAIAPTALAALGSSGFLGVWTEYNQGNSTYARSYAGGLWSGIQTLDGDSSTYPQAQLAMNTSGNGVLGTVLHSTSTGKDYGAIARPIIGGAIYAPESLALHEDDPIYLETDVAESGDAVIAWSRAVTDGDEIWVRRLSPAFEWADPELVTTPAEGFIRDVVAFDDGRVLVLVDEDASTNEPKLREHLYEPGSGWAEPRVLPFNTDQWISTARLVRARSGALMWVWYASPGSGPIALNYRVRDPSGVWSDEGTIEDDAAGVELALATYDHQSFRVVYGTPDPQGNGGDLWSARYVPGQGFRDHGAIATEPYSYRFFSIALDATGRGIVAWCVRTASPIDSTYLLQARWLE